MSYLTYGDVVIDEAKTQAFQQEPVYDEAGNVLFYRFRVAVSGVYHYRRVAYSLDPNGQDPGDVVADNAAHAPVTARELQHYLSQPRRHLTYVAINPATGLSELILDVPSQQHGLDLENGPYVLRVEVTNQLGGKSFFVTISVQCSLNKCINLKEDPSAILSNLWTSQEELDQDFLSTRVYTGRTTFNPQVLFSRGTKPDDYRHYFLPPVLTNFKRDRVTVKALENNRVLEWQVIDRERAIPINIRIPGVRPNIVTRIEAFQKQEYTRASFHTQATAVADGLERAWGAATRLNPFGVVGSLWRGAAAASPKAAVTIVARVWGSAEATRQELHKVAAHLLVTRMNYLTLNNHHVDGHLSVQHDLMGKFVEGSASILIPWSVLFQRDAWSTIAEGSDGWRFWGFVQFGPSDYIDSTTSERAEQPYPTGNRGSDRRIVDTPDLLGNCETPPQPEIPSVTFNSDPEG